MATSIGGVTVTLLNGRQGGVVLPTTSQIEMGHRAGCNSDYGRDLGKGGSEERIAFTHFVSSLSDADTFWSNLTAVVGTTVTLTKDDGQTYAACTILRISSATQFAVMKDGSTMQKVEGVVHYWRTA